jgi:hypothetical protein
MERVGFRELCQNLSVYLRRVRRGESASDDAFVRLEARGMRLRLPLGNLADLPPPVKIDLPHPLSMVLEETREDRV